MPKLFTIFMLSVTIAVSISACTVKRGAPADTVTIQTLSQLQYGRRYFEAGYYKTAMRILLPLACDGHPEAQYAVGYMYYYGYGVAQDTDVGYFWINRSAAKGFNPAIKALEVITRNNAVSRRKPS